MFITIWLTDLSWASFFFFNFLLIRCSLSLPPYYFSRFLPSMNLTREIACSLLIHPPLLPAWTVTAERTAAPEYACPPDPPPGELFSEVSEIWVTGACSSTSNLYAQHLRIPLRFGLFLWFSDNDKSFFNTNVCSSLSHVWLFVTPCPAARQAPLSIGFSQQEHWSGLPCPPPGDLPDPGIKPTSPEFQVDTLPLNHWGYPQSEP